MSILHDFMTGAAQARSAAAKLEAKAAAEMGLLRDSTASYVLPYANSAIQVGTNYQDAGVAGMTLGGIMAAAGAPIAGVGAAPGLALGGVGALSDATGSIVRGLGAGAKYVFTGNSRPLVDAGIGAIGGHLIRDFGPRF